MRWLFWIAMFGIFKWALDYLLGDGWPAIATYWRPFFILVGICVLSTALTVKYLYKIQIDTLKEKNSTLKTDLESCEKKLANTNSKPINRNPEASIKNGEIKLKSKTLSRTELKSQAREVIKEMNRFVSLYENREEWIDVRHVYHNKIKNAAQVRDALLAEIEEQRQNQKFFSRIGEIIRKRKSPLEESKYSSPESFEDVEEAKKELEHLISKLKN